MFQYSLEPVTTIHAKSVKDMIIILTTIAFAVLFVSVMNYILLTMSTLIKRAKSAAIHKTCGAGAKNLQQLIFSETAVLFSIAILAALFIIWAIRPLAEVQLGHKLISVLNPYVIWPLAVLLLALIALTAYFPGRFYARVPVATAFRNYRQKKNTWKLVLLSVQFIGASFIITMLVIVSLQYNRMIHADHGYQTKDIYYGSVSGIKTGKTVALLNELRAQPEIEMVALGSELPIKGASGNNVLSPDGEKELFNLADFYYVDENYLKILGILVSEGQDFSPEHAAFNDVLISKKGADKLKLFNGWNDVIGEQVDITEHGTSTIRGVFPDFIIENVAHPDARPAAFHYYPDQKFEAIREKHPSFSFYVLIKTHELAEAGMLPKITTIFNQFSPFQDAEVKNLELEQQLSYQSENSFRNAMMAGSMVVLLLTVMGLLGYTSNEAARRRKELAIRKINGATLSDILRSFISDLESVAIPAVLLGLIGAWFTAGRWMQNFVLKEPLHWTLFVLCSLFILVLIALIAVLNYTRTANKNPVEALRHE